MNTNQPPVVTALFVAQNDGIIEMNVGEPLLVKSGLGQYHAYPISGKDSNGPIECQRRYNFFFEFRQVLIWRFPGLFIPPISPKEVTGAKEELTVLERQYFLNKFVQQCCQLRYIAQSIELQTFLRPQGDLGKELSRLQTRTKTADRIAVLRATVMVDEVSTDFIKTCLETR